MIGFRDYIRYAEKQLRIAEKEIENGKSGDPYLIPSVILAWSAIESFVNNRLDEFELLPAKLFAPHEKAFLIEKHLQFQSEGQRAGEFIISNTNAFKSLSDKILFLMAKQGVTAKKGTPLWQDFVELKKVRDSLVHPRKRKYKRVTPDLTRKCIRISKQVIELISEALAKKVKF